MNVTTLYDEPILEIDLSDSAQTDTPGLTKAEINKLIEDNVALVKHIVFQVAVKFPRHVDREELVRSGALGLVEAAHRFDPSRSIPFASFAAQRIRGAILDGARAADWAPRSVRQLSRKFDQMEQDLASKMGRTPTTKETAAALGMDAEDVKKLRAQLYRSVILALDHQVDSDGGDDLSLMDVIPDTKNLMPSEEIEGRELYAYLSDAIQLLPERHRMVITGYFLEERSSQELSRFLGVTESRISQLRSEAIQKLRSGILAQYSDDDEMGETSGRKARKSHDYASAIGSASDWSERLDNGTEVSTRIRPLI